MKLYTLLEKYQEFGEDITKIRGIFRSEENAEKQMEKLERSKPNSIFYIHIDDLQ